jgi:GDP/UDP-N,N'-diacetylbacillosamine 2-epimerase (hydrolysing)
VGTLRKITLGFLTSSRADFGIYLPLLKEMRSRNDFSIELIVFGSHLSPYHGHTVDEIVREGFEVKYRISSLLLNDDAESIASSFAITSMRFAGFWAEHQDTFDLVFCLGDRFEMAAAVVSGIPLNIKFAHLHGGETTLGAIDNTYRHLITLSSYMHFVAAEPFKRRVEELTANMANCVVSGSISLDHLDSLKLLSDDEFFERWKIDIKKRYILVTIHPETVSFEKNEIFIREGISALQTLLKDHQLVITMPNADTNGSVFRSAFAKLKQDFPEKVFLVENFGSQSYFTCMSHAAVLVGNTSSGIIEAASFKKYVINIGDRQKGRLTSGNVIHVPFSEKAIVDASLQYSGRPYTGENLYKKDKATSIIIDTVKQHFNASI